MKTLLKKLSEAHGIPGSEGEVREIMRKELKKHCKIEIDRLGNLIAKKDGKGKRVMLAAHMDEIGLMVKHIDEKGFLKFTTLGGFNDQTLLNQRVLIHNGKKSIPGVIGSKPAHLMEEKEREKVTKYKEMFIDVGAKDEKGIKKMGINIGDYITFDRTFRELGSGLVTGKAFDNRLGCMALVEVMKNLDCKCTVYGVGTAQEEVGLKGARTSAYKINPDMAIVLDVTIAGDFPGVKPEESSLKVGGGPVITLADGKGRGLITHPEVKELLIKTAEKKKIPYQIEVGEGGTTDATAIQLTREGIPSGVVSVPARYIHTPVEVASLKDLENTVKLVRESLRTL
ncbi:MAG: M42 family metallopeptidase [Candidatus Hydrothermarchaeales archaeon]